MTTSRRALIGVLATLPLACREGRNTRVGAPDSLGQLVDLSHTLGPASPYIRVKNATFPFERTAIATLPERGVYANAWRLTEHIGTHIDAPCHFAAGAACLEAITLEDPGSDTR